MGGSSRGEKGPSSSKRSRKSGKDNSSESDTESASVSVSVSVSSDTNSGESYREKSRRPSSHRSRSKSRRFRRRDQNSDEESDEQFRKKKKKSRRDITEEEIAEYIVKKAQRKAMRAAKKLKGQGVSGYSNDSNPFGDSNLNELFVWRKKIEVDVNGGKSIDEYSTKAARKRQYSRMVEIEKVKKRREETAYEKAQREEEMAMLARERARAEFQDWEKKEEEFHFDQSKVRSQIRLKEGRTKPIDVLFKILNSDDFDIDIEEPSSVFKGLTVRELEELRDDIKMNLDMDRASEQHIVYWEALLVVCNWEIAEACKKDAVDRARVRGEALPPELLAEERGLHSSIETDVRSLLVGKSSKELEKLRVQIEAQMSSGTAKVVEYWEAVLKRLKIYRARACLKEVYTKKLRQYLHKVDKVPNNDHVEADHDVDDEKSESDHEAAEIQNHSPERISQEQHYSEDGNFSPEILHRDSDDEDEELIDPEDDKARLESMRRNFQEEQQRRIQEIGNPQEENFEIKAIKAMGALEEGDAVFGSGAEVSLDSQVYWWHDKYRPRKPKYFNRVHTGYEWNKYNQTHYDHDNPPPKIVQGYKFNIFYPDLVDKTKAPVYTIEKDGSTDETCIIRFHAGPPYEDIAFRIVNKEWEYSHKKGFKCTFERGILHVYFNFKRYRYRR